MKKRMFLWVLCGLALTSCISPQKVMYVRDMKPDFLYGLTPAVELKIQPDDRLRIVISSKNPELSAPFNLGVGGYQVSPAGEVMTTASAAMLETGYTVDREGSIEFPILGTLYVKGLTRNELAIHIKERLRQDGLINDAIVTVDVLNMKIIVMGEVGHVGVLSPADGKITLLEAIIMSGGLTQNAQMNEVVVIREDENGRRMLLNNLQSVALFDSPSFYLQQNDIVYVKPKSGPISAKENRAWQIYGTLIGLTGTILSILILNRSYR